jgi:hypothetical protein
MNDKPRYVFDTNVIISSLLFEQSKPARAFYTALDCGDILLSQPALKRKARGRVFTLDIKNCEFNGGKSIVQRRALQLVREQLELTLKGFP